jgi:hypothetical protein
MRRDKKRPINAYAKSELTANSKILIRKVPTEKSLLNKHPLPLVSDLGQPFNSARKRKKLSSGQQPEFLEQTPPKGAGNSQDRLYPSDYCFMKKNYQKALQKISGLETRLDAAERDIALLGREKEKMMEDRDVLNLRVKNLNYENKCLIKRLELLDCDGKIEKISVVS